MKLCMEGGKQSKRLAGMKAHSRIGGQCRARVKIAVQLAKRIGRGEDGEARNERLRLAPRRNVLPGCMMKLGEGAAGCKRVGSRAEGCPRDCILIEIDTVRRGVDFIRPLAELDCRVSIHGGIDSRNRGAGMEKMREKTVFFPEAFRIAHRAVMAFDEDATIGCSDDCCR